MSPQTDSRPGVAPFVPGRASGTLRFGAAAAAADSLVVLHQHELTALQGQPAGVILLDGAPFSHPALRLLSLGIPTVLATTASLSGLTEGMLLHLDGQAGLLSRQALPAAAVPLAPAPGETIDTADGVAIELRASVGSVAGAAWALSQGAAAIGLVRSEYLFPADGRQPDLAYLTRAFSELCQAAAPLSVTFRLIDIAGDKRPPWLGEIPGIAGVLGLQGARLYRTEPVRQVYLNELAALAELAGTYRVAALLPYVTDVAELEQLLTEIRTYLPKPVRLGSMLETPAAALAVNEFLGAADFAALGCNDLMQCLFAAERDQPELSRWLDPYAPTLYRFLDMVARRAGPKTPAIQVCGLLSQLPGVLPVLIGLGYRCFSVAPVTLPWLAATVRQTDSHRARYLTYRACQASRAEEVKQLLQATS
ncbi:phosphotransferase system enzyme I (PtsI) [Sulfuritortus calidifontis]|uniref:Phosphotransferase system enzyme I (PtsI) n=1 Tax=Sulfuritortus calidifontis TaxID=1914471 RepID=A0A4R3JYC0_9PROT|nr:putative PEP-binding protein [Sulfuritortus calidifontis]TCS73443.1 phosphotransferase system enzyme I (PtsI) [Sulfuritortus calidifontis]